MSTILVRVDLDSLESFVDDDVVEDMDFKDMEYAKGAGRDASKCCLPGTRKDILSEITSWVDDTREEVQRVF